MHWKPNNDQVQRNSQRPVPHYPRTMAELSYQPNPHFMNGRAIPTAHQQHHNYHYHQHQYPPEAIVGDLGPIQPSAIIADLEDLTEQIRISVQDTHIGRRSYYNESGGNVSDVHESIGEGNAPTYENIISTGNQAHNHGPSDLDLGMRQNGSQSNRDDGRLGSLASQPSTSTSSSPRHQYQSGSQASTSNLVVVDPNDCLDRPNPRDPPPGEVHISGISKSVALRDGDQTSNVNLQKKSNVPIILKLRAQKGLISIQATECDIKSEEEGAKEDTQDKSRISTQEGSGHVSDTFYSIPLYTHNPQVGIIKNYLFNGSRFRGYQKSQSERYEVNVQIQHVDYENSYLYGYLNITNLTESHPSLTTFFEGEIISKRYPFLTRKWEANDKIDLAHWSRFDHFAKNYSNIYNLDNFNYDELKNSDYIYMRWKERFLVPDHTVKKVHGASYEGFYYTCYSKRSSRIKGYYFHIEERIESFQSLDLKLDCRERNSQVYEFR